MADFDDFDNEDYGEQLPGEDDDGQMNADEGLDGNDMGDAFEEEENLDYGNDLPDVNGDDGGHDAFEGADDTGLDVGAPTSNALLEFNRSFRQQVDEKDDLEREQNAERRNKAREALNDWISQRETQIDARKRKNRDDEEATQRALDDALEGESWHRVSNLVELNNSANEEERILSSTGKEGSATSDPSRMREILIKLKADPLPPLASGAAE